ncbi:uncharacterized protein LOC126322559 [Schistocerca gregaria]|uniref:uncharacterized protein LOC126322559 n=1 Tax=Schistocerca gregaria TaxID=7010 RepID=UPI00211EBC8F|nr:uncharacterized protein LOC126322559 [Schistocerca gregaria]
MDILDVLSKVYLAHLKSEPCDLTSPEAKCCLKVLSENSLLSKAITLSEEGEVTVRQHAQKLINKWADRLLEVAENKSGGERSCDRTASLLWLKLVISASTYQFARQHQQIWSDKLSKIFSEKQEEIYVLGAACLCCTELVLIGERYSFDRQILTRDVYPHSVLINVLKILEARPTSRLDMNILVSLYRLLALLHKSTRLPSERLFRLLLMLSRNVLSFTDNSFQPKLFYSEFETQAYLDIIVKCVPYIVDSELMWEGIVQHLIVGIHEELEKLYIGYQEEKEAWYSQLKDMLDVERISMVKDVWYGSESNHLGGDEERNAIMNTTKNSVDKISLIVSMLVSVITHSQPFGIHLPFSSLWVLIQRLCMLDGSTLSLFLVQGLNRLQLFESVSRLHCEAYRLMMGITEVAREGLYPYINEVSEWMIREMALSRRRNPATPLMSSQTKIVQYKVVKAATLYLTSGVWHLAQVTAQHILRDLSVRRKEEQPLSSNSTEEKLRAWMSGSVPKNEKFALLSEDSLSTEDEAELKECQVTSADASGTSYQHQSDYDLELILVSLETLEVILSTQGTQLDSKIREKIDTTLLGLFFGYYYRASLIQWPKSCDTLNDSGRERFASPAIRRGLGAQSARLYSYFKFKSFRLAMYRTLLASIMSANIFQSSIANYAVEYFQAGLKDQDSEVVQYSMYALCVYSHIAHPRIPRVPPCAAQCQQVSSMRIPADVWDNQTQAKYRSVDLRSKTDRKDRPDEKMECAFQSDEGYQSNELKQDSELFESEVTEIDEKEELNTQKPLVFDSNHRSYQAGGARNDTTATNLNLSQDHSGFVFQDAFCLESSTVGPFQKIEERQMENQLKPEYPSILEWERRIPIDTDSKEQIALFDDDPDSDDIEQE